jgi:hypothetical protein
VEVIEHDRSSACARPSGNPAILEDQREALAKILAGRHRAAGACADRHGSVLRSKCKNAGQASMPGIEYAEPFAFGLRKSRADGRG